ncbi:MAG TPA: [protein-PII] uridylyltransferase [Acidimicrobiales bacterium]|nr:[protein-PII] uridylyltransferase [Acidimicrobiales bacterium]
MEDSRLRSLRSAVVAELLAGQLRATELPRHYSDGADAFCRRAFRDAVPEPEPRGFALVAVGGYGRRELCPGSDLDLLLLHDRRREVAQVADRIWYRVWDSGVRLDHSVRTPREALAVARTDLRAALALLDGRVVCGDEELASGLLAAVNELVVAHRRRYVPAVLEAMRDRHERFGELPYLLEPDLKESAGGLRDLGVVRLLALALPGTLVSTNRPAVLESAHGLLLAARAALHARTGNRSDRLVLQEQDEVASLLGHRDADELAAALAAAGREVMGTCEDARRRAASALAGPAARGGGREVPVDRNVVLRDGEIALAHAADLSSDPAAVLRVAAAAACHTAPIAPSTLERMAAERPPLGSRWPPAVRDAFVSLLEYGSAATPVLETLDRVGLLEWLLPEWVQVRHRPQRNAYHRYTVDRHLLETVAQAAQLLREVERPDLLLFAALLHDIGKGRPGDHSESGEVIAGEVARRAGLATRDSAVLRRLVKRHLLLADTATRRDVYDPETIEHVAEAVGDRLTLDLLAQLTVADSLATGPTAWGRWKARLVTALVENVRAYLEGQPAEPPAAPRPSPELLELAAAGGTAVAVSVDTERDRARELDEITVVGPDRTGLFALVAGVLALHRLDIRSATAYPAGEVAVELFEVEHDPALQVDPLQIEADLRDALAGRLAVTPRLQAIEAAYSRHRRPAAATEPEVRVLVGERALDNAAVLEVRAPDSRGLLHRLALCLAAAGLDVVAARIATLGHEVVDSFYVREQDGSLPLPDRLESLRPALARAAGGTLLAYGEPGPRRG